MFSHVFSSVLIIQLYFLILAIIAQIFNITAELVIPTWIPAKEAITEIETDAVTLENKISKCWV